MPKLTMLDEAYNAAVAAANEAKERVDSALRDYNTAAKAADAIYADTGPCPQRLVPDGARRIRKPKECLN